MRKLVIVDDISGEEGADPVRFSLDGVTWEVDLTPANRKLLDEALRPFTSNARRVRLSMNEPQPKALRPTAPVKYDRTQLVAWAERFDVKLPSRGRVPRSILDQYDAYQESQRGKSKR